MRGEASKSLSLRMLQKYQQKCMLSLTHQMAQMVDCHIQVVVNKLMMATKFEKLLCIDR